MPTSRDLKSGDSLFCTTPPAAPMATAPPSPHHTLPAHKLTQLPWLRTLYELLHEVHSIKICFHDWVIPEKIHTPMMEGMLENLTGGGVNGFGNSDVRGALNLKIHPRG